MACPMMKCLPRLFLWGFLLSVVQKGLITAWQMRRNIALPSARPARATFRSRPLFSTPSSATEAPGEIALRPEPIWLPVGQFDAIFEKLYDISPLVGRYRLNATISVSDMNLMIKQYSADMVSKGVCFPGFRLGQQSPLVMRDVYKKCIAFGITGMIDTLHDNHNLLICKENGEIWHMKDRDLSQIVQHDLQQRSYKQQRDDWRAGQPFSFVAIYYATAAKVDAKQAHAAAGMEGVGAGAGGAAAEGDGATAGATAGAAGAAPQATKRSPSEAKEEVYDPLAAYRDPRGHVHRQIQGDGYGLGLKRSRKDKIGRKGGYHDMRGELELVQAAIAKARADAIARGEPVPPEKLGRGRRPKGVVTSY